MQKEMKCFQAIFETKKCNKTKMHDDDDSASLYNTN